MRRVRKRVEERRRLQRVSSTLQDLQIAPQRIQRARHVDDMPRAVAHRGLRHSTSAGPARVEQPELARHRDIDQLVYQLYGLTPEEIALVEGTAEAPAESAE